MKISVIIPVKNGAATLERCLESLYNQTFKNIEIIILNSMSTDNSVAIAKKYGATVVDIAAGTFDHGLTRNIGVQHASGDLLFLTVQDAWIAEENMLKKMAEHFADHKIMAVTGHQAVPHEADKNPLKWYKPYNTPVIVTRKLSSANELEKLQQKSKQHLIAWDNVVAMYRKDALLLLPFIATEMSEDWVWSRDALVKGWTMIYDPSLVVYHYHHETYRYVYEISYAVNYHFYKFFGFIPAIPPVFSLMPRAVWHLAINKELSFLRKVYWIFHNCTSILARMNSHLNFLFYLKTGGLTSLNKRYRAVCKSIPQGTQNI